MKQQHKTFQAFVDTLDYIEVCRITVTPDGEFCVPSETDGRITQVPHKTRIALALFVTSFGKRLRRGDLKKKNTKPVGGAKSSRRRPA